MNFGLETHWILYIVAVVCLFDGIFLGWLANQRPKQDSLAALANDPSANPGRKEREGAGALRTIAKAQYALAAVCLAAGFYYHLAA